MFSLISIDRKPNSGKFLFLESNTFKVSYNANNHSIDIDLEIPV